MRRHLAYAAAGAVVLALAGCGDDPEPQVADPTSTPSSSSSPSESAAAEKEPWEEKSDDGAVAFVEHWLDVFNEMQVTGDKSDLRKISNPDCATCANFYTSTDEIYDAGGSIDTKGWKVDQIGISAGANDGQRLVAVRVQQTPQTVTSGSGKQRDFPGGPLTMTATVEWKGQSWTLLELEAQS